MQTTVFYTDDKVFDAATEVISSFEMGSGGTRKEPPIVNRDKYIQEPRTMAISKIIRGSMPKNEKSRTALPIRNDDAFLGIEMIVMIGIAEPEATFLGRPARNHSLTSASTMS